MDEKELPIFVDEQDTTSPSVIPGQHTETIELSELFSKTVTISGTFDLNEQQASSLGKLLHALPLPSLIIDRSFRIGFANKSCRKISHEYRENGWRKSIFHFPRSDRAPKGGINGRGNLSDKKTADGPSHYRSRKEQNVRSIKF